MAKDPKKSHYEIYNLYISRIQGTDNEYYAHWDLNVPTTGTVEIDHVEYQWYYTIGDAHGAPSSTSMKTNISMIGPSGSIDYTSSETRAWATEYTPPDTAKKLRIAVRPVSKTKEKNGKETTYWTKGWTYTKWYDIDKIPTVVDQMPLTGVAVRVQQGTDKTLVATWGYDSTAGSSDKKDSKGKPELLYKHIASYEFEWRYKVGTSNTIYAGTTGTVDVSEPRSTTYTPPENATVVYFRVKAIPAEDKDVLNFLIPWFKTNLWYPTKTDSKTKAVSSSWVEFTVPQPVKPTDKVSVAKGTISLKLATGSDTNIIATWGKPSGMTNAADYTTGYDYEWQYYSDGTWFAGSSGTAPVSPLSLTYNADAAATKVQFKVRPVPATYTSVGETVDRYNGVWSDWVPITLRGNAFPDAPSAPTVTQDPNNPHIITASVDIYDARVTMVRFNFIRDNSESNITKKDSSLSMGRATARITAALAGSTYKVRCKARMVIKDSAGKAVTVDGDWSQYSSDIVLPKGIDDPEVPSAPTVTMNGYTLEMSVNSYDTKTKAIQFDIVQNNSKHVKYISANLVTNRAAATCNITAGNSYKVRCRALGSTIDDPAVTISQTNIATSGWTEYSAEVTSKPKALIDKNIVIKATSSTSVNINWDAVATAESYTIEYTTDESYFDAATDQVQSVTISSGTTAIITGIESGHRYYFRLKATNQNGDSEWSAIKNVILGTTPNAPTVWSSSATAMVGENVLLYWVHNSEDESVETSAQLRYKVNGGSWQSETIPNEGSSSGGRRYYTLNTSGYTSGATIRWQVRTKGVVESYGPYSETRQVNVYAPPTVTIEPYYSTMWYWGGDDDTPASTITEWYDIDDNRVERFPLKFHIESGPSAQTPIGYNVSIVSRETYDDVDDEGRTITVSSGQTIYNDYISSTKRQIDVILGAGDANFQNGVMYRLIVTVAMDSGLTAKETYGMLIDMEDADFALDAEISYDRKTAVAYIRPYSRNEMDELNTNIVMSLYRKEFDGQFTLLESGLDNVSAITVTDPHPSLDYARYRIVGVSYETGATRFVDLPPYPTGEKSIIIQWDEEWDSFSNQDEDEMLGSGWGGSMVRLPWNVDVSDSNTVDVELIEYIGRRHPVSYYGTQVGQTGSWKTEIPAYDTETLYALRRLAVYMGNAYVREPSGVGYWAQVKVQLSKDHCAVTIPVTLEVTRVEGGV